MESEKSTLQKHLDIMGFIRGGNHPSCERIVWLERWSLLVLCTFMLVTPGLWVRHFGGLKGRRTRKLWVELYALLKVGTVGIILWNHWWVDFKVACLSAWLLADVFVSLAGYIFLQKFWQNPYSWNRSMMLLCINFLEYTSWFACLYLFLGCLHTGCQKISTASDALYFSIVTAATVGYGDITPDPGSGRILVATEICLSLFFLATVVSYFVSNLSKPEQDKKEPENMEDNG